MRKTLIRYLKSLPYPKFTNVLLNSYEPPSIVESIGRRLLENPEELYHCWLYSTVTPSNYRKLLKIAPNDVYGGVDTFVPYKIHKFSMQQVLNRYSIKKKNGMLKGQPYWTNYEAIIRSKRPVGRDEIDLDSSLFMYHGLASFQIFLFYIKQFKARPFCEFRGKDFSVFVDSCYVDAILSNFGRCDMSIHPNGVYFESYGIPIAFVFGLVFNRFQLEYMASVAFSGGV